MNPGNAEQMAAELRVRDRDRYFATLALAPKARQAMTALYAFNAEIAAVRDRAREPTAGEIRLRWWSDALTGEEHGAVRQNPVAAALLDTVADYELPVEPLVRLIEARRFDLYHDPMPDLATFEGYAGETNSVLYQLGAMVLNGGRSVETGDAAGHLGVAHCLIGHLRAFGFDSSQGRIFLPLDVFRICGVAESDIVAGTASPGLSVALTRFIDIATTHLRAAEAAIRALPPALRPVFAPVALLRAQLGRLDVEAPFQLPPELPDWRKIATLTLWRLRNN